MDVFTEKANLQKGTTFTRVSLTETFIMGKGKLKVGNNVYEGTFYKGRFHGSINAKTAIGNFQCEFLNGIKTGEFVQNH